MAAYCVLTIPLSGLNRVGKVDPHWVLIVIETRIHDADQLGKAMPSGGAGSSSPANRRGRAGQPQAAGYGFQDAAADVD